jgi:phosphate acetyltransferase
MNKEIPVDDRERAERVTDFVASTSMPTGCTSAAARPRTAPVAAGIPLPTDSTRARRQAHRPARRQRAAHRAGRRHLPGPRHCPLRAAGQARRREAVARAQGIALPPDLEILDPDLIRGRYVEPMVALRKSKSLNAPMAEQQLEDNVVLGTMMLALDEVDGLVSGAVHTTANTIRPALQLIKTAPGCNLVSSVFFMLLPDRCWCMATAR